MFFLGVLMVFFRLVYIFFVKGYVFFSYKVFIMIFVNGINLIIILLF